MLTCPLVLRPGEVEGLWPDRREIQLAAQIQERYHKPLRAYLPLGQIQSQRWLPDQGAEFGQNP